MSDSERLARLIFEGTPALARRLIATEDLLAIAVSAIQALCETLTDNAPIHTQEDLAYIRLELAEALARKIAPDDWRMR